MGINFSNNLKELTYILVIGLILNVANLFNVQVLWQVQML
jgi:hypothetical protein